MDNRLHESWQLKNNVILVNIAFMYVSLSIDDAPWIKKKTNNKTKTTFIFSAFFGKELQFNKKVNHIVILGEKFKYLLI